MASTSRWLFMVDGVEYDPWGLWDSFDDATVGYTGLGANDTSVPGHLRAEVDDTQVGTTGYGSNDIFSDDFSSGTFAAWDDVATGTPPPVLTIVAGVATLDTTRELGAASHIDKFHASGTHDTYWKSRVKAGFISHTDLRGPCLIAVYYTDTVFMSLYRDGVNVQITGHLPGGAISTVSAFQPATLDDGNWHTVGLHRIVYDFPEPPIAHERFWVATA